MSGAARDGLSPDEIEGRQVSGDDTDDGERCRGCDGVVEHAADCAEGLPVEDAPEPLTVVVVEQETDALLLEDDATTPDHRNATLPPLPVPKGGT